MSRDASFDTLLELDGAILVIDEAGYWVKFAIRRVLETDERPHGLDYELTLHDPKNERIAGFDNAHLVPRRSGRSGRKTHDHRHRFRTITAYEYKDAEALLIDFWELVESVMRELGVWK